MVLAVADVAGTEITVIARAPSGPGSIDVIGIVDRTVLRIIADVEQTTSDSGQLVERLFRPLVSANIEVPALPRDMSVGSTPHQPLLASLPSVRAGAQQSYTASHNPSATRPSTKAIIAFSSVVVSADILSSTACASGLIAEAGTIAFDMVPTTEPAVFVAVS
jgi:hypothetical protein